MTQATATARRPDAAARPGPGRRGRASQQPPSPEHASAARSAMGMAGQEPDDAAQRPGDLDHGDDPAGSVQDRRPPHRGGEWVRVVDLRELVPGEGRHPHRAAPVTASARADETGDQSQTQATGHAALQARQISAVSVMSSPVSTLLGRHVGAAALRAQRRVVDDPEPGDAAGLAGGGSSVGHADSPVLRAMGMRGIEAGRAGRWPSPRPGTSGSQAAALRAAPARVTASARNARTISFLLLTHGA